jgi:hypothetical protein
MPDKRAECGCHVGCTGRTHPCTNPCRWPDCLTPAEDAILLAALTEEGL